MKRDKAVLHQDKYCLIIVDRTDLSVSGLPQFFTMTKDDRRHEMNVQMFGHINHRKPNQLYLYSVREEHETRSNHAIEVIHRLINVGTIFGHFTSILYIFLDMFTQENRNGFLFAYLQSLVYWGLFQYIKAVFLPIAYTNVYTGQAFSRISERLWNGKAVTLEDFHTQLRKLYDGRAEVVHL